MRWRTTWSRPSYRRRGPARSATGACSCCRCSRASRSGLAKRKSKALRSVVTERLDRVEARRTHGRHHAEEDADGGGEADPDGEGPPRERDGKARGEADADADAAAEQDAQEAADRR